MASPDRRRWDLWADHWSAFVGPFVLGLNLYVVGDLVARVVAYVVR